jgi:hypothetical protein
MDLPQYLQGLSFRFIQPEQERSLTSRVASALTGLRVPLDAFNTRLRFDGSETRHRLRKTRVGSAGHPLAIRAILNRGVACLDEREAFVAFELGNGAPLLAAIAGNHDKVCIGIQADESQERRDLFRRRFDELSNGACHFIEQDFKRCLDRLDDRSIGLCFVSADSHEPVARRLADCEPRLAENAYLLIDNGNCARTRQAALDFVAASRNQYRVLLDARVEATGSLTLGQGLVVIQLLGRNTVRNAPSAAPVLAPAA